ncbi:hypothetical protein [Neobacillus niacini]|uniref:hypothetical protein n=1 Tax=Neobacillus niacini TaxID=86668 RepID=UPI0005EEE1A4|nr:hypothetical protein [Neobacillus niacini]
MLEKEILIELQEYVKNHLSNLVFQTFESHSYQKSEEIQNNEIENFIKIKRQPAFNQRLFRFIDKKGASDSNIYKRAGMDRRHFSKIRSNSDYRPSKNTVIALALALELNKKETDKLLSSAGYSLSDSDTFDLVIQFCLEKKIYDFYHVNQALDYFSLKPLIFL